MRPLRVAALALLVAFAGAGSGSGLDFVVDWYLEGSDFDPGDCVCDINPSIVTSCTLRAAIEEALACPGSHSIELGVGIVSLTSDLPNLSGEVGESLTIQGAGAAWSIIDGGDLWRIFYRQSGTAVDLTLNDLTVRDGLSPSHGGCISAEGNLVLNRVVVDSCTTTSESGGGGVFFSSSGGFAQIFDSTISNNTAANGGGGLATNVGDSISVVNTTISGNASDGWAGGWSHSGAAQVVASHLTVTNNTADADANDLGDAGGLDISAHSGGTFTMRNSIVAGNLDLGASYYVPDCEIFGGTADPRNLIGNATGCETFVATGAPGSVIVGAADLGGLAWNGGPTPTHRPHDGSPTIEGGSNANCAATDQRGYPRPWDGDGDVDAICDLGAYELGPLFLDGFESGTTRGWSSTG